MATTLDEYANGFVVISQTPALSLQLEDGIQLQFYASATVGGNQDPQCSITGSAVAVDGSRSLPLPIILPPPAKAQAHT